VILSCLDFVFYDLFSTSISLLSQSKINNMSPKKQDNKAETQPERALTELISSERSISPQNQLLTLSDAMISQIAELVRATVLQSVTDALKSFMPPELNTRNTSTTDGSPPDLSIELSHSPNPPNLLLSNMAAIHTLQPSIKVPDIEYFYPNMPSSWTDLISPSAFLQPSPEAPGRRPEMAKRQPYYTLCGSGRGRGSL
jgi:hypothetical protein